MNKSLIVLLLLAGCITGDNSGDAITGKVIAKPTDACSYLLNGQLTYTELEAEMKICYMKYYTTAWTMNDTSYCEEIIYPYEYGMCFANGALSKGDGSVCAEAKKVYYEAKGYLKQLNSQDICYVQFASRTLDNESCGFIENEVLKKECYTSIAYYQ